MMTPRERLFASLSGQPTDCAPVWLLFPYHATGYYVDVRTHPRYRPISDASRELGAIMLNRRSLRAHLHTPEAKPQANSAQRHLVEDADLESYCALPVETDPVRLTASLNGQLDTYLREKAEFPPELGSMMLDLGSPINPLYHAANLESLSVWSLTHADLVEGLLRRFMDRLRVIYRYTLERDLADVYFLVGSELASPPLVSRATFQRWIVPFERELIALVHAYGKKVIQHYHGQIREVLPDFVDMAPDGLHTIESPPVGNCTLTQAFAVAGNRITLIGNIQYDDFRSLSPAGMERAVRDTLDEVNGRRFILSPSAGPFDPDPPQSLLDNYLTFMRTARDYRPGGRKP